MTKGYKTGGRVAGTRNKDTLKQLEQARNKGTMPIEFMLKIMRSRGGRHTMAEKMEAAKAVAPYLHPRLSSVDQVTTLQSADGLSRLMQQISEDGVRIDDKPKLVTDNGHYVKKQDQ